MTAQSAVVPALPRPTRDEVVLPRERRFLVAGREVLIKPLSLKRLIQMLGVLGRLADRLAQDSAQLDLDQPQQILGKVFTSYGEIGIDLLAELLAGQLERAEIEEEISVAEAVDILVAALEVNQFPFLRERFAKAKALLAQLRQDGLPTGTAAG